SELLAQPEKILSTSRAGDAIAQQKVHSGRKPARSEAHESLGRPKRIERQPVAEHPTLTLDPHGSQVSTRGPDSRRRARANLSRRRVLAADLQNSFKQAQNRLP